MNNLLHLQRKEVGLLLRRCNCSLGGHFGCYVHLCISVWLIAHSISRLWKRAQRMRLLRMIVMLAFICSEK